jgi:hypothetical protein
MKFIPNAQVHSLELHHHSRYSALLAAVSHDPEQFLALVAAMRPQTPDWCPCHNPQLDPKEDNNA